MTAIGISTLAGSEVRRRRHAVAAPSTAERGLLSICGDLNNLGDLALLLETLRLAQGRRTLVRQWSSLPTGIIAQVQRAGGTVLDGRRLFSCLSEARRCDLIVGGGQIVRQNTSLRALFYLTLIATAVRWSGGVIRTQGLGISHTQGLRAWLWCVILKWADVLNVRDEASWRRAVQLCPRTVVRKTADMVLQGEIAALANEARTEPAIIVALCEDASEDRGANQERLLALLSEAQRRFPDAMLLGAVHDLRPGADETALARLRSSGVGIRQFDAGGDLGSLLAIYRDARLVITNRLHAGLFASLFGRPVIVLDDGNDKLNVLHEKLPGVSSRDGDAAAVVDKALAVSPAERDKQLANLKHWARRNVGGAAEIALFNVKYSPNLGDGIIAECLENGIAEARPGLFPESVDLAGRCRFDPKSGVSRRLILQVLERLPPLLRQTAMPALIASIVRYRLRPRWKHAIAQSDSVVIGGGNLLADADRNFPTKVSTVLELCGWQGVPVAISHVGVTPEWSPKGRSRFLRALARVRLLGVSVRDERSATHFQDEFAQPLPPVALDPGLLCSHIYGAPDRSGEPGRQRVGICVTDPLVLRLHGGGEVSGALFRKWLRAVIERAVRQDMEVVLFTNGSPEDEHFADEIFMHLSGQAGVVRMPRFLSPGALARFIGGLDCVVAHRLHACIAAYSYRVPAIGFSWDKKLDSFFETIGRERYICDWRSTGPSELIALIERALVDPPYLTDHALIVERCREGIADLAERLANAKAAA